MPTFKTGSGVGTTYATCLLTFPDVDWYKRNIVGAINELTLDFNWFENGDVGVSFAVEESEKMLERMLFMGFNPIPVGLIHPYASATIPEGFLLCDGATLDTGEYPELFTVIGYSFGGSGSAFTLPDLTDRTVIGSSSTFPFGDTGGEEAHTLTVEELAAHGHTDTGHTHVYQPPGASFLFVAPGEAPGALVNLVPGVTGSSSANIADTGSDSPHNNMQPYMGLTYMIYAGR
jgi:microcystin-dependent protein